ncbi:MAG: hypothetical protein R3336_08310, partial [Phycisphaeraceae bacterium]|nr:hypothetical protein [Phycisphaeraceae bacterium]
MSRWQRDTARNYGDLGEQAHVAPLAEALGRRIGAADGKRLFDFGCGEGELAGHLLDLGFEQAHLVDENDRMVD